MAARQTKSAVPPGFEYLERLQRLEHHIRSDRFAEFTRGALQDNIILCDQKSGILLAFGSAVILFCVQAVGDVAHAQDWIGQLRGLLLMISAIGFAAACYFALMSVAPRIRKTVDDGIFWGSHVYDTTAEAYIARYHDADPEQEMSDKLRHLHTLAGICREKYRAFNHSLRLSLLSFIPLLAAELIRH